ncbi:hypothetical protein T4A_4344 [Trichinella pseudospiralis]|uniref:Uncharacterized protein n=1 Tax=Trichinella pseudospiralis TaxID=6337 RepID=A0A0V1E7N4_TRIPS|nr:hypothetical protein T4A_4344 [Trichinella pseudospiralis]
MSTKVCDHSLKRKREFFLHKDPPLYVNRGRPQWQRDESTAKPRESLLRIWNFDGLLKGDNQEERTRARLPAGELSHLPDVRYDGINHTLGTVTQGRCGVCQRNTKNETQQQKCSVRLHTEMGEQASKSII